ncbi:hypothetical protein A0U92_03130 [Acetobacter aceti]|uniref:Uncharacterized protein n=1 Tax=Acetobacter aceti TaxID=435 RepID=A0A1U9KDV4_ACEAC|nr:hypothetical protein A0U92_03130 [Acetobacter aceti]
MKSVAEHADATDSDQRALPDELARRETLKAKLDEACSRLEADAKAQVEAARPTAFQSLKIALCSCRFFEILYFYILYFTFSLWKCLSVGK